MGAPPEQAGLSPTMIACSWMATFPNLTRSLEAEALLSDVEDDKLSESVFTVMMPFTAASRVDGEEYLLEAEYMLTVLLWIVLLWPICFGIKSTARSRKCIFVKFCLKLNFHYEISG